jgi:hypothetical protein
LIEEYFYLLARTSARGLTKTQAGAEQHYSASHQEIDQNTLESISQNQIHERFLDQTGNDLLARAPLLFCRP